MKVTRLDVARLAGVSTATVSYVMNHSRNVKPETLEKVQQAIKMLNYQPNLIAQSLSTNRTMQIGIVLENISNPYYAQVVEHFEAVAIKKGYFVNICTGSEELDNYFDNFIRRSLDGVFVAAMPYKFSMEKIEALLRNNISLVVSGNHEFANPMVSSIENDYRQAMRDAVRYLYSLGHSKIAYLSGLGQKLSYDVRLSSYLEEMRNLGLVSIFFDGSYPYHTDATAGYDLTYQLLQSGHPFTAIICGNDLMAIGAIRALKEHSLHVPEDVSVLGFDNIALGCYETPSISTMAVDAAVFGQKAFELLYNNMTEGKVDRFDNKLQLIERESTGACILKEQLFNDKISETKKENKK